MFKSGESPIPGYQLVRFLGRGAYGEVWESHAPGGTRLALKFIPLQSSAGGIELKSANAVKLIRHANLIPITAIWLLDLEGNVLDDESLLRLDREVRSEATITPDELTFKQSLAYLVIAMALADDSLESKLAFHRECGEQGIPTAELVEYIREAAKGLDFLNEPRHKVDDRLVGIVHRDVKPANLLLLGDAVVVGDFGMATSLKEFDDKATVLGGSLGFMAPESISRQPTKGTDQYALAITYYYLRTGQTPYDETQTFDSLVQVHKEGLLDFSLVSEAERAVLRKATAVVPDDRYSSCTEFVKAIAKATDPNPISNDKPSNTAPWIVASAALLLAAIGLVWYFGFYKTPNPQPDVAKQNNSAPSIPAPMPQPYKLTLVPGDIEFEVAILRPDSEDPEASKSAKGKLSLELFNEDRLKISSKANSSYWLPLDKTFTHEELVNASWEISLQHKTIEDVRKEAFQLAAEQETSRAVQMLVDTFPYEPTVLDMPAQVEQEENLEILKLVSGQGSAGCLLTAKDDDNKSILRLSGKNVTNGRMKDWIPSPTDSIQRVVYLSEQDAWLIFSSRSVSIISNQGEVESNWKSEENLLFQSVAVSEKQRIVVAGDLFGNVHAWEILMEGLENHEAFAAHSEQVADVLYNELSNEIISRSTDGTMRKFSVSSDAKVAMEESFVADGTQGKELFGAVVAAESQIVMASEEGELFVSHFKQPSMPRTFSPSIDNVSLLRSSVKSPWVLIGTNSLSKNAVFIDVSQEEIVEVPLSNGVAPLAEAAYSEDGKFAAFSTTVGELFLVDLRGDNPVAQLISKSSRGHRKHLSFTNNSDGLVSILTTETGDVEEDWDLIACQVVLRAKSQVESGKQSE